MGEKQRNWKCDLCPHASSTKGNLQIHFKNKHSGPFQNTKKTKKKAIKKVKKEKATGWTRALVSSPRQSPIKSPVRSPSPEIQNYIALEGPAKSPAKSPVVYRHLGKIELILQ